MGLVLATLLQCSALQVEGEGPQKFASDDRRALQMAASSGDSSANEPKIRGGASDDHHETIRLTDKNGDGLLTLDELIGFTHEAMNHFPDVEHEENDKKIAMHFAEADVNHDGFLNIEELATLKRLYWAHSEL